MTIHESLFTYGSLQPGESNHDQLQDIPGTWVKAKIKGIKYQFCSGLDQGYPVVVLSDGTSANSSATVDGWILSSAELGNQWPRLDDFEGDFYHRVEALAETEQGEIVAVFVYVLNEQVPDIRSRLGPAKP